MFHRLRIALRRLRLSCLLWYYLTWLPLWSWSRYAVAAAALAGVVGYSLTRFGTPVWAALTALPVTAALAATAVAMLLIAEGWARRLRVWRLRRPAGCPRCRAALRTGLARQCFGCGLDWHRGGARIVGR